MNFFESISSAISSVFANKMRTFLTMIGVIIGVSSVITIMSLGRGFEDTIKKSFEILNSKALQVMPNWGAELTAKDKIFIDDVYKLEQHPNVKYVSGYTSFNGFVKLKNPDEEEKVTMFGSNTNFSVMQKNFFRMKYGRVYTEQENKVKAKVCLLDEDLATKIFGRQDVVGEHINLFIKNKQYDFEIIGVTTKENVAMMGHIITMPIDTALDIFDTKEVTMLYVELKDTSNLQKSKNEIVRVLSANHDTTDDKYMVISNMEQVKQIESVINMFTIFIGFVAGISLLVGGIGVMNIMLVTVTERTKEIGIRKSLGATSGNIKMQFLIESVFICVLGGIIGIITGFVSSVIIGEALNDYFTAITGMETMPPVLSLKVGVTVMCLSTFVGVIFGVYPAGKAAKLDPIQCLRYE